MSKNKYMTKYQLEHLKKRVSAEIDPIIEEAKLMRKSPLQKQGARCANRKNCPPTSSGRNLSILG